MNDLDEVIRRHLQESAAAAPSPPTVPQVRQRLRALRTRRRVLVGGVVTLALLGGVATSFVSRADEPNDLNTTGQAERVQDVGPIEPEGGDGDPSPQPVDPPAPALSDPPAPDVAGPQLVLTASSEPIDRLLIQSMMGISSGELWTAGSEPGVLRYASDMTSLPTADLSGLENLFDFGEFQVADGTVYALAKSATEEKDAHGDRFIPRAELVRIDPDSLNSEVVFSFDSQINGRLDIEGGTAAVLLGPQLFLVDLDSGTLVGSTEIEGNSIFVELTTTNVWVSTARSGIAKLDRDTLTVVDTVHPTGEAEYGNWTLTSVEGRVWGWTGATLVEIASSTPVPATMGSISQPLAGMEADSGRVWALTPSELVVLDGVTGVELARTTFDRKIFGALAVLGDSAWVEDYTSQRIHRYELIGAEATAPVVPQTTNPEAAPEDPAPDVAASCTVRDESLTFTDSDSGRIESGDESEVYVAPVIELDLDEDGMPESIYYHDISLIRGEVGTIDESSIRVGLTTVCSGDVRLAESVSVHEKNASQPFIIDDSLWMYSFSGLTGGAAPVRLQDMGLVTSGPFEQFWYNSECDGSGLIEPDPDVPPAVSETRAAIAALAAECDVEGLLELVPEAFIEQDESGQTVVSNFGTGLLPPEPFAFLNHGWFDELLAMEGFEDVDGSWVFPKLAATACSDLSEADIAVIDGFAPMGVSLNCGKFGEFVSPWLRISADGQWIEYQIGVYGSGR